MPVPISVAQVPLPGQHVAHRAWFRRRRFLLFQSRFDIREQCRKIICGVSFHQSHVKPPNYVTLSNPANIRVAGSLSSSSYTYRTSMTTQYRSYGSDRSSSSGTLLVVLVSLMLGAV